MTVPSIDIRAYPSFEALARALAPLLTRYPYCVRACGFDLSRKQAELVEITKAVAALAPVTTDAGPRPRKKVSFTKVWIDPAAASESRPVTAYSRTAMALPPHTDSSYSPLPHEFVTFLCARDDKGGENSLVPVDHVLSYLDGAMLHRLAKPVFPFGRGSYPVLEQGPGGWHIRYYRAQIDRALADHDTLEADDRVALDALDQLLDREDVQLKLKLAPGEALMMHNKKVLHGRSAISAESDRLLYRIRYHIDLDAIGAGPGEQGWIARLGSWFKAAGKPQQTGLPAARPPEEAEGAEEPDPLDEPDDTTLQYYEQRVAAGAKDEATQLALAQALMAKGRFVEAHDRSEKLAIKFPESAPASKLAAALAHRLDDNAAAQAHQARYAVHHPYEPKGEADPDKPTILQPRGLAGASYSVMRKGGWYRRSFEGGHFSLKDLLPRERYNVVLQNIFDAAPDAAPPSADLLLNNIACADRMPLSLKALETFLERHDSDMGNVPVINHPRHVLRTSRAENAERLDRLEGVEMASVARLTGPDLEATSIESAMEQKGMTYPVIMRPVGSHTGSGVLLAWDRPALLRYAAGADRDQDHYLIQYRDLSDDRGLYHKMRLFCIDGRWYPVARLTHNEWNVHSGDRYAVMDKNGFTQDEERAYLADMPGFVGPRAVAALAAIRDTVGLDFFGVDAELLPDGSLLIFECNAAMRHNFDHARAFPYTAAYLRAISRAFAEMVANRIRTGI